jgi:hypothetical protein
MPAPDLQNMNRRLIEGAARIDRHHPVRLATDHDLIARRPSMNQWWGANSTVSDRHQLDEPPGPHSMQNETLDVREPRRTNSRGYTNVVRST